MAPPVRPEQPESPVPHLSATPARLEFGSSPRRLAVVLTNDGEAMLTVRRVAVDHAAFRVEPLGTGPFWIRPGRSRDIFISYLGGGPASATLHVTTEAPAVAVALHAD